MAYLSKKADKRVKQLMKKGYSISGAIHTVTASGTWNNMNSTKQQKITQYYENLPTG